MANLSSKAGLNERFTDELYNHLFFGNLQQNILYLSSVFIMESKVTQTTQLNMRFNNNLMFIRLNTFRRNICTKFLRHKLTRHFDGIVTS